MSELETLLKKAKRPPRRRRDYAFRLAEIWGEPTEITKVAPDQRALKQLRSQPNNSGSGRSGNRTRNNSDHPGAELSPQAPGSWAPSGRCGRSGEGDERISPGLSCSTCGETRTGALTPASLNSRSPFERSRPARTATPVGFWRHDGTRFQTPDPERVRELLQVQE
jgi:hypothetical protein